MDTEMFLAVSERTVVNFYLVYAAMAIGLVVFLARTLQRNGAVFLEDAFDDTRLASSINQLLVVGFYLLNMGYALLIYRIQPSYESLTVAFNELVTRIGMLLLSLGVIHLLNMLVFWKIRTNRNRNKARLGGPQLPPASAFVPPPPMASGTVLSGTAMQGTAMQGDLPPVPFGNIAP
ncbi:MAG: hypothetical protein ACRBK7_07635 [Acidimicrobiales bacterium]